MRARRVELDPDPDVANVLGDLQGHPAAVALTGAWLSERSDRPLAIIGPDPLVVRTVGDRPFALLDELPTSPGWRRGSGVRRRGEGRGWLDRLVRLRTGHGERAGGARSRTSRQ